MKTTHIHNIPLANPIVSYLINLIHNYKTPIHLHTSVKPNKKVKGNRKKEWTKIEEIKKNQIQR